MNNTKLLNEIPAGETFKIGDLEFFKVTEVNGTATVVCKNILYNSQFGKNNNFAKSLIFKKLTEELLPQIEVAVGAENVLEFETDLLALDGSAEHGTVKSKISLPTLDFYRQNRAVFEKHKVNKWWWLATPYGTPEYNNDYWVMCVSPAGDFNFNIYFNYYGVRPILNFVSSISVSCEE